MDRVYSVETLIELCVCMIELTSSGVPSTAPSSRYHCTFCRAGHVCAYVVVKQYSTSEKSAGDSGSPWRTPTWLENSVPASEKCGMLVPYELWIQGRMAGACCWIVEKM